MNTPCPKCPHWAEVHNADGSCGCGMNCGATPPRPTTEEGRTDPLLRPHDESEGEPRSSTGSTGNDAHKTESDQRGTAGRDVGTLARPTTEEDPPTISEKRSVVNLLRESDYYPDQGTSPEAGNDGVVEDDWDRYQTRLASAGFTIARLAAPPSDQEEPPAPHRCTAMAGRCEKDSGHDGDHYTEYREPVWTHHAASTPVPALAEHEATYVDDGGDGYLACRCGYGHVLGDDALVNHIHAARLSGDEGGAG